MLEFVRTIPRSADLEWAKDIDFLYYFEAERLLTMRRMLMEMGFRAESRFRVLDFGYLHGVVPEFLHRFFPLAQFTVLDHPESPNFRNDEYLQIIRSRTYLSLQPCNISNVAAHQGQYDLMVLGEIIEHLDPTVIANAVAALRPKMTEQGCLLITTPNAAGIRNTVFTFLGRDAQHPPIPDETMNYGHIHLWTPALLERTLVHYGWRQGAVCFSHGFERWYFRDTNRHWGSLRHQLLTKLLFAAACLCPRWRGFMVSAWRPSQLGKT